MEEKVLEQPVETVAQPAQPVQPQIIYVPTPAPEKKANGLAIGGFVCSLLGILSGGFSFILSLVGLILSASSRKKGKTGLGTAGLVLGIIGVCLSVIVLGTLILTFVIGATSGIFEEIFDEISSSFALFVG